MTTIYHIDFKNKVLVQKVEVLDSSDKVKALAKQTKGLIDQNTVLTKADLYDIGQRIDSIEGVLALCVSGRDDDIIDTLHAELDDIVKALSSNAG